MYGRLFAIDSSRRTWLADRMAVAVFPGNPPPGRGPGVGGGRVGIAGISLALSSWWLRMTSQGLRRSEGWLVWTGLAVLTLTLAGGWVGLGGQEEPRIAETFWQVGEPASIEVCDGRASFRVPTPDSTSEVLVVVSALSRASGPFAVQLKARSADVASVPNLAVDGRGALSVERSPRAHPDHGRQPARGLPPNERLFSMLVRDGDVASPSNYTTIRGVLRGVGHHVAGLRCG